MFPSIPLDVVIDQATNILQKRADNKLSKENIKQLFEFCTNDTRFFNEKFYQQVIWLTMGFPLAPVLANLYFSNIENEIIFSKNFPFKFKFYYRFVDDVIFIFEKYYPKVLILNYFNKLDINIDFTVESEQYNKLNFLDVCLVKNDLGIETRWFRKSSNTLRYSAYASADSKIYKVRLIYTMINKITKIYSTKEFYDKDINLLKMSFWIADILVLLLRNILIEH